jgi:adenylate kinase
MDYNLIADRPTQEGRCDVCGGELVAREDDTEEAVTERLRLYRRKTAPILELFGRKEYVVTVDARPGIDAVQRTLRQKLGLPAPR